MVAGRPPQAANAELSFSVLCCSVIITLALLGAVIAPVVWVFMWFHGVVTKDDPPPFKAGAVVELTKRPTSFDDNVSPYDHERPHGKNEPFGMNGIKDEIYADFFPKLGNPDAKVAIDCGDAKLEDHGFQCVASHDDVEVRYGVGISQLQLPYVIPEPGRSYKGMATWKQHVAPLETPLFRDAVHLRIWDLAHHHEEAAGVACSPMPEVSVLIPDSVTEYRCHFKYKVGLKREWVTHRITLDESGDISLDPVRDEEER